MGILHRLFLAVLTVAILFPSGTAARADERPTKKEPAERTPDQQVKDLIQKYEALQDKAKIGPEGTRLIEQLRAVRGNLSPQSREAIARLETSHNLRQLALAVQKYHGKELPKGEGNPAWFQQILPYLEQQRSKWEYKVVTEAEVRKLGNDDLAAGLNKLGEDSWELVTSEKARFIFKRQK